MLSGFVHLSGWLILSFFIHHKSIEAIDLAAELSPDEIKNLFETKHVPNYQVLKLNLGNLKNKENSKKQIPLGFNAFERNFKLKLKPTDGYLVPKFTPAWSVERSSAGKKSSKKLKYKLLPTAIADIGTFQTYHDTSSESAITIFHDVSTGNTAHGIVKKKYAIKPLPERFTWNISSSKSARESQNLTGKSKGALAVRTGDDVVERYHVIYETGLRYEEAIFEEPLRHRLSSLSETKHRYTRIVYPELMIVADQSMDSLEKFDDLLKYIIAFWNCVDMSYSSLKYPRVRLNIAGILIAKDDGIFRDVADREGDSIRATHTVIKHIASHFGEGHSVLSSGKMFDILITMTKMKLCNRKEKGSRCDLLTGAVTAVGDSCPNLKIRRKHTAVGIFTCNTAFGGVEVAIQKLAHLLGAKRDNQRLKNRRCLPDAAYAMAPITKDSSRRNGLKWSPCTVEHFRRHLTKKENACFDNEPRWLHQTRPLSRKILISAIKKEDIKSTPTCRLSSDEEFEKKFCRNRTYKSFWYDPEIWMHDL